MTQICSAVDTEFTPSATPFIVQVTGGTAALYRKNASGAAYAQVAIIGGNESPIVDNPVSGAVYKFVTVSGTPTVSADQ